MKTNSFVRKLVAVLLVAVMCVPFFSMAAVAAAEPAFSVSSDEAKPNEIVTVTVSIYNNPGIAGLSMQLNFDKTQFIPISVNAGNALGGKDIIYNIDSNAGVDVGTLDFVSAVFYGTDNITENGVFFSFNFVVKSNADAGKTEFTAICNMSVNEDGDSVNIVAGTGEVDIVTTGDETDEETDEKANIKLKTGAASIRYMAGFTDGTFRPNDNATRYQVVEAFYKLFNVDVKVGEMRLKDVDGAHNAMVKLFVAAGVLEGYPDNTFRGTKNITRAEFCKIICCLLNLDTEFVRNSGFTDVPARHWAKDYIDACAEADLIEGKGNGRFAPDANITRAEVVTVINRITGAKAGTACSYNDVARDAWYFGAVAAAAK